MKQTKLTAKQRDVLAVVDANQPVTTADVGRHLPIGADSARSALYALERKGLLNRQWSGFDRGYGWTITAAGATLQAEFDEE